MCKVTSQSHKFWRHSNSSMIFSFFSFPFFPLFVLLLLPVDFVFVFLPIYLLLCAFNFVLLLLLLLFFCCLFILSAVFISVCVGLGLIFCWWEKKFSYFGVVYKYLSVGMEMAVIKELFIILYISDMFFTNLVYFFYIYLFILLSYFNFSYSLCCVCYECVVINTWWCASLCVIVL